MNPYNPYRNAEYDKKAGPVCPRDCPKRKIGCHDASTCETWAEHERRKEIAYKQRRADVSGSIRHKVHK